MGVLGGIEWVSLESFQRGKIPGHPSNKIQRHLKYKDTHLSTKYKDTHLRLLGLPKIQGHPSDAARFEWVSFKSSSRSVAMQYDGLDRLDVANGAWGSGSFDYDTLGNLTYKSVGGVNGKRERYEKGK